MLELLTLGAAGAAGLFGHVKSKDFINRKLRYTSIVEKPAVGLGVAAGAATAIAVAALPVFTLGPGLLVGAGIGTGVAAGIKKARRG